MSREGVEIETTNSRARSLDLTVLGAGGIGKINGVAKPLKLFSVYTQLASCKEGFGHQADIQRT